VSAHGVTGPIVRREGQRILLTPLPSLVAPCMGSLPPLGRFWDDGCRVVAKHVKWKCRYGSGNVTRCCCPRGPEVRLCHSSSPPPATPPPTLTTSLPLCSVGRPLYYSLADPWRLEVSISNCPPTYSPQGVIHTDWPFLLS